MFQAWRRCGRYITVSVCVASVSAMSGLAVQFPPGSHPRVWRTPCAARFINVHAHWRLFETNSFLSLGLGLRARVWVVRSPAWEAFARSRL